MLRFFSLCRYEKPIDPKGSYTRLTVKPKAEECHKLNRRGATLYEHNYDPRNKEESQDTHDRKSYNYTDAISSENKLGNQSPDINNRKDPLKRQQETFKRSLLRNKEMIENSRNEQRLDEITKGQSQEGMAKANWKNMTENDVLQNEDIDGKSKENLGSVASLRKISLEEGNPKQHSTQKQMQQKSDERSRHTTGYDDTNFGSVASLSKIKLDSQVDQSRVEQTAQAAARTGAGC